MFFVAVRMEGTTSSSDHRNRSSAFFSIQTRHFCSHFYIIGNSAFLYSDGSRPLLGFLLLLILFKNKQPQTHFHRFVCNGASQKLLLFHSVSYQWSLRTEYGFAFAIFHYLAFVVHFFILPQSQVVFLN